MSKRLILIAAAAAMASSLATAHEDGSEGHTHDHAGEETAHDHTAKHGGIVVHSGHHHLELVAEDGALHLYVTAQDGTPEAIDNAKADATILSGGEVAQVTLEPASENTLKGMGSFVVAKGMTVVVNLTLPDHETEQARFRFD